MKYSFIVPVYGCEKYLRKCVESLVNQTYANDYEIILVDDGSKDKSGQIADELANKYPFVFTFHKPNGGASSARNVGIQKAKGEYLLFIDGDDTVELSLLDKIEKHLQEKSLVIFGMAFDYYQNEVLKRTDLLCCSFDGMYSKEDVIQDYTSFFQNNVLSSACNKVFLRKILVENSLYFQEKMTLYEDYDFVLRYLSFVDQIVCIPEGLYHYRHDLDSIHIHSRTADLRALKENLSRLNRTLLTFSDAQEVYSCGASVYMSLLFQHLMQNMPSMDALLDFVKEEGFQSFLTKANLSGNEKVLFENIRDNKYGSIRLFFLKKRMVRTIKNGLKKVIRRV
ncbi:MAG: glycosyltransferase family 2 protein [Bacillota bacterium]|nr:glycosyltransferase family 2 protein [Bacillota bacterium]